MTSRVRVMGTDQERLDRFFDLALNAKRADDELRAEFSDAEYEQVLDYVAEHPDDRPQLAEAFVAIAYDPSLGPIDLVEYCMYALQWPEVRGHFIDRLEGEPSERARSALRRLLKAFEPDWPYAELYRRFSKCKQ